MDSTVLYSVKGHLATSCKSNINFVKYSCNSYINYVNMKIQLSRAEYGKLIKKKIKFFIYKEIQSGAVTKLYMWKGFLIYEEMRKYFFIYEEAVSHI
jgi:hypothetical protein